MPYNKIHVFLPIFGLAVNVLTQVLSVRLVVGLGILRSIVAGFIIGGLAIFLIEPYLFFRNGYLQGDVLPVITANLIIYGSLGYCYFHFINLGITARRIRILRELYDSREGLSLNEILKRYNSKDIINNRLERLLNSSQIVYKDGRYYIGKPIMLLMSKIIVAMKLIILGKRSEFD